MYKHLGTQTCIGCNNSTEVYSRCAILKTESSRLRSKVLAPSAISLKSKTNILQAYLFSKGTFHCCTWETMPPPLYKKFHHAIIGCYRDITNNKQYDNMYSDDHIVYEYKLICPMTLIRLARIQLLLRMLRKAPAFLLELMMDISAHGTGWPNAVRADLGWLCMSPTYGDSRHNFHGHEIKCIDMTFVQWCGFLACDLKGHAKRIKKWGATPAANIVASWATSHALRQIADPVFCETCSAAFDSNQKLHLHMFKKHGIKHPIRRYVTGTHCTICLKEFWNRERVINHLKYKSHYCRNALMIGSPLVSESEAVDLDSAFASAFKSAAGSGARRHHAALPCVQLYGPFVDCMMFGADGGRHHPIGIGRSYAPVC